MEEAIVDVAVDLNMPPAGNIRQPEVQEITLTNNRDVVQFPSGAQTGVEEDDPALRNRAARVEALRLNIAAGTYQIDNAELALCLLRNSTRFLETR
ncbi:MAG TPA: flagellar biosynthesis anti-sigma factor FlgM [Ktedonobacteraceae bacterium]|nr:flagellar biosynthesis anti-sigma factor FlgM [Ktedonobacteraceae bacterium]